MIVLVTGGAGFIGSTVVDRLFRDLPGVRVRVLDDLSTGRRENLSESPADLIVGSITDPDVVGSAMDGVSAVLHLAAIGSVPLSVDDPVRCHQVNVTGTIEVLEAARKVDAQVVFASSSAVYGTNPATPIAETDWTAPLSPYAASKLAAESYLLAYRQSYGLAALALRFFNVYGPRQDPHGEAGVVAIFAQALLEKLDKAGIDRDNAHTWMEDGWADTLRRALREHVEKGDPRDVAAYSAFAWHHGWSLAQDRYAHLDQVDRDILAAKPEDRANVLLEGLQRHMEAAGATNSPEFFRQSPADRDRIYQAEQHHADLRYAMGHTARMPSDESGR